METSGRVAYCGSFFLLYGLGIVGVKGHSMTGSEKRRFQEQLRKTKFPRAVKKNEVFQEKFWVT
ncbi:MAG: hypothetical protein RSA94_03260, partial [Mucinivorans sp.]